MEILNTKNLSVEKILSRIKRVQSKKQDVETSVKNILMSVKTGRDKAVFKLTEKFDEVKLTSLKVDVREITDAYSQVSPALLRALKRAKRNIVKFHKANLIKKGPVVETEKGVKSWREFRPIEKVGLYVPGGKAAYPSTVLMLAVPAKIAGCEKVIICTPVDKFGKCNPAVLVAADICGVSNVYKIGGAQAIAAMAYGTETVPRVYKIFGPGNQYVTTAKMLVYGEVDIDMPAGPSEVLIIADKDANPRWIAADALSQLEHGEDSQSILITFSEDFARKVIEEMKSQIRELSRKNIIAESFGKSFAIIVDSEEQACEITNEYAPEHLEIITKNPRKTLKKINNAGSVFLGEYSSEPLGDYASGANHTLPTSGYAKMFNPLSAESFGKMMQVQKISKAGIKRLKKTVEIIAESEGLTAHKKAITIRDYD
ncbi:MAG: histidinol dehydrogenase, histidinol dehydrogenase [Candidatus Peregrinibacteria bacterium GW2011_GWF2_38_29]|nr:MAG: histidinol dehydrogenase, histidinol dehydrogenase [Candidatus Peregrinibacteria bacterium GW2011_GWF2_38_29]HBB02347.1 histidinol dehydrogenase [Candidatus Peregrinibacteria bacterium]